MSRPTEDTISELIGPVCHIAELRPNNGWPEELRALIGYARRVKALYGFETITLGVDDPLPPDLVRKLGG